jgi:hypothetical protein
MAEPAPSATDCHVTGRRRTETPTLISAALSFDGGGTTPIRPPVSALARIEMMLNEVQHTLSIQFQRIAAMQAEVDRLAVTIREHIAQRPNGRR